MNSISCSKYFWKAFGQSLRRSIPSSANFIGEKKERKCCQLKKNYCGWSVRSIKSFKDPALHELLEFFTLL